MADITMCDGVKDFTPCPQRMQCYRFTAPVNPYRQSYFTEVPATEASMAGVEECPEFTPNFKDKRK